MKLKKKTVRVVGYPIKDYVKAKGVKAVAAGLNRCQSAVYRILREKRDMYIQELDDGTLTFQEIKTLEIDRDEFSSAA